jgi:hypothetical protein
MGFISSSDAIKLAEAMGYKMDFYTDKSTLNTYVRVSGETDGGKPIQKTVCISPLLTAKYNGDSSVLFFEMVDMVLKQLDNIAMKDTIDVNRILGINSVSREDVKKCHHSKL